MQRGLFVLSIHILGNDYVKYMDAVMLLKSMQEEIGIAQCVIISFVNIMLDFKTAQFTMLATEDIKKTDCSAAMPYILHVYTCIKRKTFSNLENCIIS